MRILTVLLVGCLAAIVWLPNDAAAFVSSLKGASTPAHRPPTVSSSSSSTTLHAVAKKKKAAAKKKTTAAKKAGAATKKAAVETVNKSELVKQMADQCGLSKLDTESVLNAFLEVVQENVAEGKKVTLVGFGSFTLKDRAARKGRNPQTGEEMDIPASKAVGFSAGKAWKDRVNGK